jgi:hypothetical protein
MNSCLACGADNVEDVLYCSECGKRLEPPAPPPEFWRYNTEDLNPPRQVQPNTPPAYQPPPPYTNQQQQPPPYTNRLPYAPQQGYEPRPDYAPRQGYAQPPQGYGPQQNVRPYGPPAPYQPPYPAPYPPAPVQTATTGTSLPRVAMTMGIVLASVTLLGLIPCLGWLNWFTLIFGKMTIIISIVALVADKDASRKSMALIGLVLASSSVVVAIIRLIIGGGCL